MPTTPDDANRDVIDFESLQLKDVPLGNSIKVIFGGKELMLTIFRNPNESDHNSKTKWIQIQSRLYPDEIVKLRLTTFINWSDADIRFNIEAEIIRISVRERHDLPRKIGMALYNKLFDYLQSIANQEGNIRHTIQKAPVLMSSEKWDENFMPLITEHHYVKIADQYGMETWEKVYKSSK